MMHYRKMSKNYVFREYECGLSVEETANLCFKSVKQVKKWDAGHPIPKECKRLMRMTRGRELSSCAEWERFKMHHNRLETPNGKLVSAQEVLAVLALLEIEAPSDMKTRAKLLQYARAISRIRSR